MTDARFEEGQERPLRLIARDGEDLKVISALVQDSILGGGDLRHDRRKRRFSLLINRFRWEDRDAARTAGRAFERVRSVLDFGDVTRVAHQGLERRDRDTVLSLLALAFTPATPDDPASPGRVVLTFAGDGAIALDVDCLDVTLADVTRPYIAPSRRAPEHGAD
ncbi:MAG: Protein of unknown function (DUF2948) [Rhodobacteraceae bacterium HLUCCA12]|nr:MAG: Protein of unknown function (DUF2948) [Rhodobacteraceae bacterium HLUCCA12]